eukprot:UN01627
MHLVNILLLDTHYQLQVLNSLRILPSLFTTAQDRELRMWDLEANIYISKFHGHSKSINTLDIHPVHNLVITGSNDRTTKLWDVRTKKCVRTLEGHREAITTLISCPTDPQVITGSLDTTIRLWDIVSGRTIATHAHHRKSIRKIVSHPQQHTLISASADSLKKWRLPIISPEKHQYAPHWVAQSTTLKPSQQPAQPGITCTDLSYMLDYHNNNKITTTSRSHNTPTQPMLIQSLAVDENTLVSGSNSGELHFYEYDSGKLQSTIQNPIATGSLPSETPIFDLKFDLTGQYLLSACADKTVKIYQRQ